MTLSHFMGNPVSVRISEIIEDSKTARTLLFQHPVADLEVAPGQFLMVWIAGVDEIPMSVSYIQSPVLGMTVLPIGDATTALASKHVGAWVGIRGPFGTSFTTDSKRALVVGGGIGIAPLRPLVYTLLSQGSEVTLLIAAQTKDALIYLDEFSHAPVEGLTVELATNDGSAGYHGLATEAASAIMKQSEFDALYTCGPELMMVGLYELALEQEIRFEASLERHMKCGCGICGTCALDPTGDLVCTDGPVFTGDRLSKFSDFGKYDRDLMGRRREIV
ncbi:MAG: dihydroorotate dehydrogenase electron transfer subunit [Candidatus Thorarchaeota archaeon]|nr:MAG: dihydroorotate dehydrogenase electron transfer subunit [Candidatus Thorarchaeota archaeon]RLI60166.1 MAG: dihydroorotate dehydrogenase electron transfer subunit [Candidatus Thorarchaeota archaeon]